MFPCFDDPDDLREVDDDVPVDPAAPRLPALFIIAAALAVVVRLQQARLSGYTLRSACNLTRCGRGRHA